MISSQADWGRFFLRGFFHVKITVPNPCSNHIYDHPTDAISELPEDQVPVT